MSQPFRESGRPLDELIGAVESFADDPAAGTLVSSALADAGHRLVYSGFLAHRAPDGTAWAPLKRPRVGEGGVLVLTGALRDASSSPVVTPDGFVMTAPWPQAVHQRGSRKRNLPARPFFPDRLPSAWEAVMEASADDALTRWLP